MEVEVHRDLGKHDAQIESLQDQVERLHADMANVLEQLRRINNTLSEARGGWRLIVLFGGGVSALSVIATKLVEWLLSLPGPR